MLRVSFAGVVAALACAAPAWGGWAQDAAQVRKGITKALATGWISTEEAAEYRSLVARSTYAWERLPGDRGRNLGGVMRAVAAQRQAYIAPRAHALFSMLDLNTRYLAGHSMPASGFDVLDGEGVLYRSFPGHGLQFHPLGNFARLEALVRTGRQAEAAVLAGALLGRAIPRRSGAVWEYYFPFGGGQPPWTSGMVQALAARALAANGDLDDARRAYLALPPLVQPLPDGPWIRLYSFSNMAVLNAQLESVFSLYRYADLAQDVGAAQLAGRLLSTSNALWSRFDTGAWSRYSLWGAEAPLKYHRYVIELCRLIAARTKDPLWRQRATRLEAYTTEPPKLIVRGPAKPVKFVARISVWVSKLSVVTLNVGGSKRTLTLSRGSHVLVWNARSRRPGRYGIWLRATDLAGNQARASARPIVVKRPAASKRRRAALR